jgi:DNA-binding protein H-NS
MPTLEQIQAKLKKLKAQEEALIEKRNQSILAEIHKLMETHGLTIADIDAHASMPAKRRGRPAGSTTKSKTTQRVKAKASNNGKLPAKYRDPKSGATWSGWARPPLWIKDVKDRSRFLISGSVYDDTANDPGAKKASAKMGLEPRPKATAKPSAKSGARRASNKKISRKLSANKARNVPDQAAATSAANASAAN